MISTNLTGVVSTKRLIKQTLSMIILMFALIGFGATAQASIEVYEFEMVMAGQSDAQIREYMYERYGDFISYKPPVRPSTWILWYFPPLILLLLVAGWLLRTKARNRKQVTTVQATEGTQQTATTHNSELDKVGANLSSEEAQKLKDLLKEHSNKDLSNKE